jgi:hypothetical protein
MASSRCSDRWSIFDYMMKLHYVDQIGLRNSHILDLGRNMKGLTHRLELNSDYQDDLVKRGVMLAKLSKKRDATNEVEYADCVI